MDDDEVREEPTGPHDVMRAVQAVSVRPGEPELERRLWVVMGLLMFATVLTLVAALVILFSAQNLSAEITKSRTDLAAEIVKSREANYQGRGVVCQALVSLGAALTEPCKDPNVRPYYDPTKSPSIGTRLDHQKTRDLLCLILRNDGREPVGCADPPGAPK